MTSTIYVEFVKYVQKTSISSTHH